MHEKYPEHVETIALNVDFDDPFEDWDKNNDGGLTEDEVDVAGRYRFGEQDKDGDGIVSNDEYMAIRMDELRERVTSKLSDLGITFEAIISSDPTNKILSEFELFGLPAVVIYGPDGKLYKKFDGLVDYENDIYPLVDKLIAGK